MDTKTDLGPEIIRGRVTEPEPAAEDSPVEKVANGKPVTVQEAMSATDWFLSDTPDDADEVEVTHTLEIDVGTPKSPQWVKWVIRPLDADEIKEIQKMGLNRGARRRGGETDLTETNRRIVVAGTVDPNLRDPAILKGVADPAIVLAHRFRHKPLLIDQISGEILTLSGADEEAIRDSREVRAALG